jgi:hypothetical protein
LLPVQKVRLVAFNKEQAEETMSLLLYTDPKGKPVYEFSHSAANDYRNSPAAFYWKRIRGYKERLDGAALAFGIDLQEAVRRFYLDGADPQKSMAELWAVRKTQELDYGEKSSWEQLDKQGQGLMGSLKRFNSKLSHPFFPTWKERLKITDHATGAEYVSIPDIMDKDKNGPFLVDIKALGRPVDDEEFSVIMDSQLRTQAATAGVYRVVLWVFVKTPSKQGEYRIQWLEGEMTQSHAWQGLNDDLSLVPQIVAGKFPCRCGIRWPNDGLSRCPYRGLCKEQAALDAPEKLKKYWAEITATELKPWDELGELD